MQNEIEIEMAKKELTPEEALKWITDNSHLFKLTQMDEAIGCTKYLLQKVKEGRANFPAKFNDQLVAFVKEFIAPVRK